MSNYNVVELIEKIKDKKDRIELHLLFIEEYSGWLQHLNGIGLVWGAAGEECKANNEGIKTRKYIDKLKENVIKEIEKCQ